MNRFCLGLFNAVDRKDFETKVDVTYKSTPGGARDRAS